MCTKRLTMGLVRGAIGVLLLATAAAKLLPTASPVLVSGAIAYAFAAVELLLTWGILRHRGSLWPGIGVMTLAIAGVSMSIFGDHPCGCTGPVVLARETHFLLCVTLGFLGSLVVFGVCAGRESRGQQN